MVWTVANTGAHALIGQTPRAAVAEVVASMESGVAASCTGATTGNGTAAQVDAARLIATAYDQYDSRADDPHHYARVVVSNKVQTVLDRK